MIVTDVAPRRHTAEPVPGPGLLERAADRVLRGPLALALVGLCLVQLVCWIPHYLTWPWYPDHDVFATLAREWDLGTRPYRDARCNNFPGTIYLFWLLGRTVGWGKTAAFYACDAALVALLGGVLLAWSRRRFGRILPGAVAYATVLGWYLGLDYTQTAQRDWHAPWFAVLGLLLIQAWPGRPSRWLAALAIAMALTIRPQAVLFLPALALALDESARPPGAPLARSLRAGVEFALVAAVGLALAFAPLAANGLLGDFLQSLKIVSYGGTYNHASPARFAKVLLEQLLSFRLLAVPIAIGLLLNRAAPPTRRLAITWLAALAGVLFYKPLSPMPHEYLNHPATLVWSIHLAILVELLLDARLMAPVLQLVAVVLALGLEATGRPRYCNPGRSLAAVRVLRQGEEPAAMPTGYTRHTGISMSGYYHWEDYRAALHYLRTRTPPEMRVANALKRAPAVTGPTGRPSAFPAESLAWLRLVRPDDEAAFAAALEQAPRSVVVWSPDEFAGDQEPRFDLLADAITRHYEPEARFGAIEVWRRREETDR